MIIVFLRVKIWIVEYRTKVALPHGIEIVEFQQGDTLFAKIELGIDDLNYIRRNLDNKNLVNMEKVLIPKNIDRMCSWWDIDTTSVEEVYSFFSDSNKFDAFSVSVTWLFVVPKSDEMFNIYIISYD